MILFKKVRAEHGWLSNMSPHPVGEWRTAEALFQSMRFNDPVVIEEIKACTSPMGAKMIAKSHADKMKIVPRSAEDLALMDWVLTAKVFYNRELWDLLLATGDQMIVEDVSARQNESGLFWGGVVKDGQLTAGQNHLGKLWMKIRERMLASGLKKE